MKNKEKYSKKIVELACDGNDIAVDKRTGKVDACLCIPCSNCLFNDSKNCDKGRRELAESEYVEKPVISKIDKAFLEYIREERKYIARDEDGKLCVYSSKPFKEKIIGICTAEVVLVQISLLQQTFQWSNGQMKNLGLSMI